MESLKMDLKGKMDLYISYSFGNIKFDRVIKNEEQLKNFINELIELKKEDINVKVLEIYNNLGY